LVLAVRAIVRAMSWAGHTPRYASAVETFDTRFDHFFRSAEASERGDHVFLQAHPAPESTPGLSARRAGTL